MESGQEMQGGGKKLEGKEMNKRIKICYVQVSLLPDEIIMYCKHVLIKFIN